MCLDHKRHHSFLPALSLSLSRGSLALGKASGHVMRTLKQASREIPMGRAEGLSAIR